MGSDLHLSEEEYWHKQLLIIWDYVQKVHNYQILKMNAEFTVDEDGQIWFLYADEIVTAAQSEYLNWLDRLTFLKNSNQDGEKSEEKEISLQKKINEPLLEIKEDFEPIHLEDSIIVK